MTTDTHETAIVLLDEMTIKMEDKISPSQQLQYLLKHIKDIEILTKEKYFISEINNEEDHSKAIKINTAIASIKARLEKKRKEIVKAYSSEIDKWDDEIKIVVKNLQSYQDEHNKKLIEATKALLQKRTDIINTFVKSIYSEMNVLPEYQTAIFADIYTNVNSVKDGVISKKVEQDIKSRIQTALNTQLLHQIRIKTIENVGLQRGLKLEPVKLKAILNLSEEEFNKALEAVIEKSKPKEVSKPTEIKKQPEVVNEKILLTFEAIIEVKAFSKEEALNNIRKTYCTIKSIKPL